MAVHTTPRTHSVRRTLLSLLLIPLLSLAALWGFTASIMFGNVIDNQHLNTLSNALAPGVIRLEAAGEAERALTVGWLSSGRGSSQLRTQLLAARRSTDSAAAAFRAAVAPVRGLLPAAGQAQLDDFLTALAGLPGIRTTVDAGTDSLVTAFTAYTAISTTEINFFLDSTATADPALDLIEHSSLAFFAAEDFTGGALALTGGALSAHGEMGQAERTLFAQVVAEQNLEVDDAFASAGPTLTPQLKLAFESPAYRQLLAMESQVADSPAGRPIPVSPATFQATDQAIQASDASVEGGLARVLDARWVSLSDSLETELYLAAGLGLAAVAASVFVAVRFGRRLRGELTSLYDSARQMAEERLPRLVDLLRRGDNVDVQAESPPLQTGRVTEIAHVAAAFTAVQRTAVEAAVGQAALRKGVNQVFVSLSLRNQSLLHRQLSMLDEMERATSDPVALGDLFRLDHLTTRMRRHAEGLLILAGSTPGRGWRDPVPAADVLNAAVAEVEDYVRVDVVTDSADAVAGTAVNDVIHLLAELIENATQFSPPNTRVEVRGNGVGHGFAIEVEDRGLGMPPEEIIALNARLANPPEFDLANSDQLGLFVTARLAQRHDIKISLRQSPFGGTTAIVLLPLPVIVPAGDANWTPSRANVGELPSAPAGGLARDPGQASGTGFGGPAFGLTGRHRRPGAMPESRSGPGAVPVPPPRSAAPTLPPSAPHPPAGPATASGWFSRSKEPGDSAVSGTGPGGAGFGDAQVVGIQFSETVGSGSRPALPRRARGTNLAPQLRAKLGSAPPGNEAARPGPPAAAEPPTRSPEDAGSLLSALQDGWERGRIDNLDDFELEDQ